MQEFTFYNEHGNKTSIFQCELEDVFEDSNDVILFDNMTKRLNLVSTLDTILKMIDITPDERDGIEKIIEETNKLSNVKMIIS